MYNLCAPPTKSNRSALRRRRLWVDAVHSIRHTRVALIWPSKSPVSIQKSRIQKESSDLMRNGEVCASSRDARVDLLVYASISKRGKSPSAMNMGSAVFLIRSPEVGNLCSS